MDIRLLSRTTNIVKHPGIINRTNREKLLGQRGLVVWFSGLSGSGKSTLAHSVEEVLHRKVYLTQDWMETTSDMDYVKI